jgi:hypothetical protein
MELDWTGSHQHGRILDRISSTKRQGQEKVLITDANQYMMVGYSI